MYNWILKEISMQIKNAGDLIVGLLVKQNIKRVYGIVGDSLNAMTDAIRQSKTIQWVHTRHEEVAAFAAGAEAQLTGQLAVCAGSCGPGNLHLINGLYDCHRNRVPVLAIAAHIPSLEIGGHYFQETHPEFLFKECSFFCELVSNVAQLPRMMEMAIQTALAKRGVAVLVIPGDIALQKATNLPLKQWLSEPKPTVIPNHSELQQIAKIINEAKKVTILAGHGAALAHKELVALAKNLQAPIVHTLRGKEYLEHDNPYDVGMTGFIGFSSGYYAMEACDTLFLLGTSFPYRQFYPSHAKIIQIDIDGAILGSRCSLTFGAVGDVKATIDALMPLLKSKADSTHLNQAVNHYHSARKKLDDLATGTPGKKLIHPQYLARIIDEQASQDAIFSCDVGETTVWAARYLKLNGKRSLLASFNHGSMANALAQAIGAQAAFPNRQVIAMCGDGGFTMSMGDLLTLVQMQLPVKVIIFNNGTLGFVELEMKAVGFLDFGTELINPNFADLAISVGISGIRVEDPADLETAIKSSLQMKGPALIDVRTNRTELIMPPKVTAEQMKGFSLYITKAILNGKGDDLLELASTHLWR